MSRKLACLIALSCLSVAVSAQPAPEEGEVWILPTLLNTVSRAAEPHFQTSVTFANPSNSSLTVSFEFFDDMGQSVPADDLQCGSFLDDPIIDTSNPLPLAPHELHRRILTNRPYSGWARLINQGPGQLVPEAEVTYLGLVAIECSPDVSQFPTQGVLATVDFPAVRPGLEFSANGVITPHRESAFAVVNPSSSQAHVEVTARRQDGSGFDISELFLEPGQRLSLLLFELLIQGKEFLLPPERPDSYFGEVRFRSDVPIAVGGLDVLLPDGKWTSLQVTRHSSGDPDQRAILRARRCP